MQKYGFSMTDKGTVAVPSDVGGFYLASEVDAVLQRQASAALAGMDAAHAISRAELKAAQRLRGESSPEALESERRANSILTERVAELEEEVQKLQRALAFWLPHVPSEDTERGKRIGDDTYLLIGYEGEMEADAEERGWIKLTELMVSVTK